ncbi:hypothetical protein BCR39DRAFT_558612 [Naematelia encephala]|uniref:G-protein coupled receptors family 1 profile domain-containing protein n=1 Tax=Naematelia encephala TaxID=71784 RepID=A0A1Y2B664_9TREE|nr:hypothetical protein BCR39DRAFT_558612 [Naematelia encephala]
MSFGGYDGPTLSPRDVLTIANLTSSVESYHWVEYVDLTMLTCTIAGALLIIGSMTILEFQGRTATTRMRIVQSLVISDLILGITGLIGTAKSVAGDPLRQGSVSCDGLGVMIVTVLWTEHLWTLALAFATYMILIHPLHSITSLLEKRWYILWLIVWVISFAVAVLSYELYGFTPSGGICFYPSKSGLYGELMQFVPRGFVFLCITFFYIRLFVFLRRPDKIRSPYSNSPTGSFSTPDGSQSFITSRRRQLSGLFRKSGKPATVTEKGPVEDDQVAPTDVAPESILVQQQSTQTPNDIPPWERLELPTFQIDGQRYGGSAANMSGINTNIWSNWKGLGAREKKRPSTASSGSQPPHSPNSPNSPPTTRFNTRINSKSSSLDAQIPTIREIPQWNAAPRLDTIPSYYAHHGDPASHRSSFAALGEESPRQRHDELSTSFSSTGPPRKSSTLSDAMPLTPRAQSPFPLPPQVFDRDTRRPSAMTQDTRRPSTPIPQPPKDTHVVHPSISDPESSAEDRDKEDGNDMDLMHMLRETGPPGSGDHRFHPHPHDENVELVPESMASYLNRKTALLMLWFPLGYVLLFSVSLVRLIYDFVGQPPVVLRAISRWFIFAQGLLDALIYGYVEWHTKRVVRRRVRRGTFSPETSQHSHHGVGSSAGIAAAFRSLTAGSNPRRSRGSAGGQSQNQSQIDTQQDVPLPSRALGSRGTVSFAPVDQDPRSILQELQEADRKGSVVSESTATQGSDSSGRGLERKRES